jgi:hypothetical protein
MDDTPQVVPDAARSPTPLPPVLAPVLMMAFWMLLGGAAGIKVLQSIWRFLGFDVGDVAIAVPVGGGVGALVGALLGLISNPHLLVLLMAVFAGSAAGAVAGQIPWGDVGEIGGQVAGGLLGGIAWAAWLFIGRRRQLKVAAPTRHRDTAEENQLMPDLRGIEQAILANGRVDGHELEALRRQLYAGGKIERREADFLVELHKRVQHRTPAFEKFFHQAIKDHILADGRIDAEEAGWLQRMLFADGTFHDEGRKLLHELKGEAEQVSPEFAALFAASMKQPPEQRTCG